MCLVKFPSNENARLHFQGVQHYNRIMIMKMKTDTTIWCEICCCECNTMQILDIHKASPKHLKKEQSYVEIMQLKSDYLKKLNDEKQAKE